MELVSERWIALVSDFIGQPAAHLISTTMAKDAGENPEEAIMARPLGAPTLSMKL